MSCIRKFFEVEPELIFTPRCIRRHRRADLSIEVHVAVAAPEPPTATPTAHVATCHETPDGRAPSSLRPKGCGAANEQDTVLGWHDETNGRWPDYIAHEATHAQLRDLSFHTRWVVLPGFQLLQCRSILGRVHSCPPGLAAIQFCVLYVTFGLLCIPAPKVISLTGPKWGIAVGMLTYVSLVASFLAPPYCTARKQEPREHHSGDCWSVELIWALRLVTAVLVGVGASLVWTGQGVYLGQLAAHAVQQEELEMEAASATSASSSPIDENPLNDPEAARRERLGATLKRYNGIFWTCFQFSGTCGLVASSLELTLVQSASSTSYLFLGLTASCLFGVVSVIAFLPTLPAVTPLPRSPNLAATSTPVAEQESAVRREIVGTIATEIPQAATRVQRPVPASRPNRSPCLRPCTCAPTRAWHSWCPT